MTHITIEREELQTVLEALESCDQVMAAGAATNISVK
jgi:hypothetical protein